MDGEAEIVCWNHNCIWQIIKQSVIWII